MMLSICPLITVVYEVLALSVATKGITSNVDNSFLQPQCGKCTGESFALFHF